MNEPVKKKRGRKALRIFLIAALVVLLIRIILPYVLLHYANKSLAELKGYYGRVKDIDLALIRGAYTINDIYLHKRDTVTELQSEFFAAEKVDLSVEWGALFKGKIVGAITIEQPSLLFEKEKTEPKHVEKDTSDFKKMLNDFMPLRVNRLQIHKGTVHYIDQHSSPQVDVVVSNIEVRAENLSNAAPVSVLPATVTAGADLLDGHFDFRMKLDPLAEHPTFDLNTEVTNINLVKLNDFFKAYGKVDINSGTFGIFVEGAGKDGKFVGYFKPLIRDLDVLGPEDKDDSFLRKLWEGVAGATGELFSNQKKDQIATKVPIEGSFENTKVNVMTAVVIVLRNAFIQSLQPAIDHEISLKTVHGPKAKQEDLFEDKKDNRDPDTRDDKPEQKGFFKRVFGKDNQESKKDTSKKEKD